MCCLFSLVDPFQRPSTTMASVTPIDPISDPRVEHKTTVLNGHTYRMSTKRIEHLQLKN